MTATCETCDHYHPFNSGDGGECHRFPPQMHPVQYPNGEFSWETHNPIVYAEYRCGEWTQKIDKVRAMREKPTPIWTLPKWKRRALMRGDFATAFGIRRPEKSDV